MPLRRRQRLEVLKWPRPRVRAYKGVAVATRERLSAALSGLGFRVLPSQANFVLARRPGESLEGLFVKLRERGILVRYFAVDGLRDALRITVGTDDETDRLLDEMGKILS